jgi:hypothetical protein
MNSIKDDIESVLEFAISVSIAAVLTVIVTTGAIGADVD